MDKEESAGGGAQAEYELVPPDGGWGWLVLAGSMMVNILIPGTIKSFGVLFVEFLEAFEASSATAAWIPALCYFLYSSLGNHLRRLCPDRYSFPSTPTLSRSFQDPFRVYSPSSTRIVR